MSIWAWRWSRCVSLFAQRACFAVRGAPSLDGASKSCQHVRTFGSSKVWHEALTTGRTPCAVTPVEVWRAPSGRSRWALHGAPVTVPSVCACNRVTIGRACGRARAVHASDSCVLRCEIAALDSNGACAAGVLLPLAHGPYSAALCMPLLPLLVLVLPSLLHAPCLACRVVTGASRSAQRRLAHRRFSAWTGLRVAYSSKTAFTMPSAASCALVALAVAAPAAHAGAPRTFALPCCREPCAKAHGTPQMYYSGHFVRATRTQCGRRCSAVRQVTYGATTVVFSPVQRRRRGFGCCDT